MAILPTEHDSTSLAAELKGSALCAASSRSNDESMESNSYQDVSFPLKPARRHRQFLPDANQLQFESLKGYDHTRERRSHLGNSPKAPSSITLCSTEKMSVVENTRGGSWLRGFALIRDETPLSPAYSIPDLVRSNSSSSLSSDDSSISSSKRKGVSFDDTVAVLPIPHTSTLTTQQRRKMYSSSVEVRQNKIRNKMEYRYDGQDWRNCTEEWEMSVCMITGELIHPAHSI